MKVFVGYPPLRGKGTPTLGQNRQFQWFHHPSFIYPLVPASAATLLANAGYAVAWKDAIAEGLSWEAFAEYLSEQKPDLIALETKTPVVRQHWEQTRLLKKLLPRSRIVLMGDHVTALPDETMRLSEADYALLGGDYDFSLLRLAEHLSRGAPLGPGFLHRESGSVETTGPFDLSGDLDSLPLIDRDLTRWNLYGELLYKRTPFTYTMAGRDCPHGRCTFCAWTVLYPKFRVRSPRNLVSEIRLLVERYGVREVFDDTGSFPAGGWLEEFCRLMTAERLHERVLFSANFRFEHLDPRRAEMMKRAGFRLLKLGLESANDSTLERLDKKLTRRQIIEGCEAAKAARLEVHLTVMLGYPWESLADIQRTIRLVRTLMREGLADMLQSTVIVPYPGTRLYREALDHGWFRVPPDAYERFDMTEPVLATPGVPPERLMRLCRQVYESFFEPRYLLRRMLSLGNIDELRFVGRGLGALAGHLRDFSRS